MMIKVVGFWPRLWTVVGTVVSWGYVVGSLLWQPPADLVLAIDPLTLALIGGGLAAGGAGAFFGSKKRPRESTLSDEGRRTMALLMRMLKQGGVGLDPSAIAQFLEQFERGQQEVRARGRSAQDVQFANLGLRKSGPALKARALLESKFSGETGDIRSRLLLESARLKAADRAQALQGLIGLSRGKTVAGRTGRTEAFGDFLGTAGGIGTTIGLEGLIQRRTDPSVERPG